MQTSSSVQYELYFQSVYDSGRGFAFPCDDHGSVDLNALTVRARDNYLRALQVVGRELMVPAVQARPLH